MNYLFSPLLTELLFSEGNPPNKKGKSMKKGKMEKQGAGDSEQSLLVIEQQDPLVLARSLIGAERNLETIGFFSPTTKARPKVSKKIEGETRQNGQRVKRKLAIIPSVEYGRPIAVDLDMYRAFFKILREIYFKKGKIENPVGFRDEDMIRAMGKARYGRLTKEIREWLSRMKGTLIESENWIYDKKKKKNLMQSVTVFDRIIAYGQEIDGKKADMNFVWLSDWFLGNLNHGYIFLIDHDVYKCLRYPIAKCLYGLLWWGFYSIKKNGGKFYWKDYSELCKFLDIAEYKYESKIREKLTPSHEELIKNKVISQWDIERQTNGKFFNIKWWPGEVFETYYLNYQNALTNGNGRLGIKSEPVKKEIAPNQQQDQLAEQLIKFFHQELKGVTDWQPKEKELERARELVGKYQKEQVWYITKYAVARIKETDFVNKVAYFGAIINYVDDALKELDQAKKVQQKKIKKKQEEVEQKLAEYKAWLQLSPEERVKGRLEFWIQHTKTFKHHEPNADEIKEKQQELIESEPTPEEKQEQIFGRVIYSGEALEMAS